MASGERIQSPSNEVNRSSGASGSKRRAEEGGAIARYASARTHRELQRECESRVVAKSLSCIWLEVRDMAVRYVFCYGRIPDFAQERIIDHDVRRVRERPY